MKTTTRRRALLLGTVLVAASGVAAAAVAVAGPGDPALGDGTAAPTAVRSPATATPEATVPGATVPAPSPAGTTEPAGPAPTEDRAPGAPVSPVLAFADVDAAGTSVEAAGFVPEVVESGGECRLVLTQGSAEVTSTSSGEADASTTNCGLLSVPVADLAPGTWQVRLGYRSDTSSGISAPLAVDVRG